MPVLNGFKKWNRYVTRDSLSTEELRFPLPKRPSVSGQSISKLIEAYLIGDRDRIRKELDLCVCWDSYENQVKAETDSDTMFGQKVSHFLQKEYARLCDNSPISYDMRTVLNAWTNQFIKLNGTSSISPHSEIAPDVSMYPPQEETGSAF